MFSRVCAKPFRIFLGEFCSASGVCIAATALLLLCASDARWSQKGSSLESLGRGRRGSGVKGECWLAKVVSAVERDLQALSAHDSQHNAIPCRCSISSCILTCNSSLWCLERNLFYSKQGLPRLRSCHCFCYRMLCFPFYFSPLCPRKGFWNMFLFSTLQKSFLGWSCAKTLGTGKYPEKCKDD